MKVLNKIITSLAFAIGAVCFTACESNSTSLPNNPMPEASPETIVSDGKKDVLDSLSILSAKVDSLTISQTSLEKEVESISNDLTKYESGDFFEKSILTGLAILSIIIVVVCSVGFKKVNTRLSQDRQEIDSLKATHRSQSVQPYNTQKKTISSNEYSALKQRIDALEKRLSPCKVPTVVGRLKEETTKSTERTGYFGVPSQMSETDAYFPKLIESCSDSEVRFSANINGDYAEFKPLEGAAYLNDIKSTDSMKLAIDLNGCSVAEANCMTVLKPGEAKFDNRRWIITKKAMISLQR